MRHLRNALLAALVLPAPALAHGLWGHIHVTGWAVENRPDDELRAFLLDPEVFNALIFGAAFTDSGYARDAPGSRAYAEATHWEPFIEAYVDWMRVNDPPPWTTPESKRRVGFLLGCASHGLQDEIFDSLFLHHAEENDGVGQDATDPATDGFLALDGHLRFFPVEDLPMELLLELYADVDPAITEEVIRESVGLTMDVYINEEIGVPIAEQIGREWEEDVPWIRAHYLDADLPGSLRSEIFPTMAYQEALWERLHARLEADEATVFAYPETPRRLLSGQADSATSWVTLVFGVGVAYDTALVSLSDASGAEVPYTVQNSQWGPEYTRVLRLLPAEDLTPGGWYTARLAPGVETIDGGVSAAEWTFAFQVDCDPGDRTDCPDLGDIPEASLDGIPEEAPEDTAAADDTGAAGSDGCGCAAGGGSAPAGLALLLVAAAVGARRRRG